MLFRTSSSGLGLRKRTNLFSFVCAIFFSCYLGLLLPLHHHADGAEHDECAVCAVQGQPADVTIAFCLTIIPVVISSTVICQKTSFSRISRSVYLTRAPPITA
jgi:hypothetical protein